MVNETQFDTKLEKDFKELLTTILATIKNESDAIAECEVAEGCFEFAFSGSPYSGKSVEYYGYKHPADEDEEDEIWEKIDSDAEKYRKIAYDNDVEVEIMSRGTKAQVTGTYANVKKAVEDFGNGVNLKEIRIEEYDIDDFRFET